MLEDENIALKNKIDELKLRLQQIYAESFMDLNKSKAFEYEFSLYLKASEHARDEGARSIKLQNDTTNIGLMVLMAFSALSLYVLNVHMLFGMLLLLFGGFFGCGFMYLLLVQEIRMKGARKYSADLEAYFKRHRWAIEQQEKLNLPTMPLWEDYASRWNSDRSSAGYRRRIALYAPFRFAVTSMDLLAIAAIMYTFISRSPEVSWIVLAVSFVVWAVAVILQMLLVDSITGRGSAGVERTDTDRPEEAGERGISWRPGTWGTILRLFLVLDIISPKTEEAADEV